MTMVRFLAAAGLSAVLLHAVDGTVVNQTTGKPQANVVVSLVEAGEGGMKTVGSAKSGVDGKFRIDKPSKGGPALLQAIHQGVTYNQLLAPGGPASGIEVGVYDVSASPETARVSQHMILLQPAETQLSVSETYLVQNDSKHTYNDPANGTLRFYLPPEAAGKAQVSIAASGGMPVSRTPAETRQKNVFMIDYPVRPGETRFDLSYVLPPSKSFTSKVLHKSPARLVTPASVSLSSESIESVGQEPTTQARIYDVKARDFSVNIEGTGTLRSNRREAGEGADETGAPQIRVSKPRLYDRLFWVLGLSFAILALGFALLWGRRKV